MINHNIQQPENLDIFFCEERSYDDPDVGNFWEELLNEITPIIKENNFRQAKSLALADNFSM
ncbi:MAG: hypothetical protein A2430_01840 [Candidatus Liptonbacteria bacterium RIFOXYC1_FULL_36_8]|uniref:Uncharacterized protein n=2 Tax=Candidatus Liptoniibacteriota TaxID=1817909 RepID=A0A1G2CSQ7_9BACT|nr:MAG: hypothetical protein A2430_01840 [Candidatus Liptonbacteria bacterium RIFOXYC1_FULL_36_8]OGZ04570.1 MAG: hypothetical protein A2604_01505 [Candidatus Liptonbacteria bacterium RIFOXYD1_FULL_36_11]